ncbi:fibronectin type III domain-containing protein [Paenibacillus sp. LjRoot56]|uniref:fibronectin type III domain-containing protein n=1 Tax=Paenibacillus sp. LjRoot56 TaxID=3342333 RepID=UPI003ECC4E23
MRKGMITKASVTLVMALLLHIVGAAGMACPTANAAPIVADSTWKAIDTTLAVAPGSALDLSYLNQTPAGTKGFVKIDADGDYYFTDEPNKKVKFFGTNLNGSYGTDPTREEMVIIADRLAAMGYNVVRYHSNDDNVDWAVGLMVKPTSTTVTLDPAKLDNFEYFVSLLKDRGIYIDLDILAYADYSSVPSLSVYGSFAAKYMATLFPDGKAIWRSFAQQWLTHVNPYTGLALKDDPILMGLSPMNETILYNANFSNASVNAWLKADFNTFLAGKARPPITTFPNIFWSAPASIRDDLAEYFTEKTLSSHNEMKNYLKDVIGVKAPIGGINYINDSLANYWRTHTDVHETHLYNGLVDGRGATFSFTPASHPRYSMVFAPESAANYVPQSGGTIFKNYIPGLALGQLYQKPFALTEYNQEFPTKGRDDLGLMVAATGAFNGWDMLNRFQYVSRVREATQQSATLGGFTSFDTLTDTLVTMSEYQSTLLFRKGHITASEPKFVIVRDQTSVKTHAASTENEDLEINRMYIPHLFKMVTVYADKPGEPYAIYKITPELTPEQIASGNIPAQNKISITNSMTLKQVAETFINAIDDVNLKNNMLSNLNQNKLVSDTGELIFDLNLNTYLINTPYAIGAVGTLNNNLFELGPVSMKASVDKGTVSAATLDDKSLDKSERMLVIYTTDVAATGEDTIQDLTDANKRTYVRGKLPTLAKHETMEFHLKTTLIPAAYKAYKLATNGVRLQEIPVIATGKDVFVQLDTDKGFAFELVYDPLYTNDFESGAADWTSVKGNFALQTESSGNHVYQSTKSSTAVVEQTVGTDYFVESDVRIVSHKDTVGLLARYVNPDQYYSFTYDALFGKAVIEKRSNGTSVVLQTATGVTLPLDIMNKLRFEVVGSNLNGYINGQLVVTATDNSIASGSAGILTKDLELPAGFPWGTATQQWIAALGNAVKSEINATPGSNGAFLIKLTEFLKRVKGPVSYDNFLVAYHDITPPSVPSNVTATALSSYEMSLSWTPSTDNGSVAGYIIYRDGQKIATLNGVTTNYKDTGLSLATTYHYTVQAVDPANNRSAVSVEAVAVTKSTLLEDNFESGSASMWSVVSGWGTFGVVNDGGTKAYLSDNAGKGATKSVAGLSSWTNYRVEAKGKMDKPSGRIGLVARFVDYNNYYSMTYENYTQKVYISKLVNGTTVDLAISNPITPLTAGSYHSFGFTVSGNILQAYVDGQLVAMTTDSSFSAGKIGVYTHLLKAYFDDIVVNPLPNPDVTAPTAPTGLTADAPSSAEVALSWAQASDDTGVTGYTIYRDGQSVGTVTGAVYTFKDTGLNVATTYHYTVKAKDAANNISEESSEAIVTTKSTLLEDNFESGSASGWSVVSGWGTFSVVSDVYGSKAYLSNNADKGGVKSVAGSTSWTNYSVEAKGKMETASGRIGLVARFVDYNNYYSMSYDNYTKKVYITKLQNGVQTDLAISAAIPPLAAETYHTLRFTANGNTLQAYVNGQLILTATASTFSAGKIGVYTHLSKAYFDDVVVNTAP